MGRKSMFKYGMPSAANSLWPQIKWTLQCQRALVYLYRHEGKEKTPLCIHRAPLGTHERFIGFLIEHYGGNFPLWLAPSQVVIIPVAENHHEAASNLYNQLQDLGIRAKIDLSKESFGKKIRQAKVSRAPYFIIIGDKDLAAGK